MGDGLGEDEVPPLEDDDITVSAIPWGAQNFVSEATVAAAVASASSPPSANAPEPPSAPEDRNDGGGDDVEEENPDDDGDAEYSPPNRRGRGGSGNRGGRGGRGGRGRGGGGRGKRKRGTGAHNEDSDHFTTSELLPSTNPKRRTNPKRGVAPRNLTDDVSDSKDWEDTKIIGEDDDEDEEAAFGRGRKKEIRIFEPLPDDSWLNQGLDEEELKAMDPSGFLKKRKDTWAEIERDPFRGHAESDQKESTYCYLCENKRRPREGTDESIHYDSIMGFLDEFLRISMPCATHYALQYYDKFIFPATQKVMTQKMFMNHILKHNPNPVLITKWMLTHSIDVQLMIRSTIKPPVNGEPPDAKTVGMMHQNNKDMRNTLAMLAKLTKDAK